MRRPHITTLPRWVEIPSGILLGIGTLLTATGAVAMLIVAPARNAVLVKGIGAAMLLLSLWCLEKAIRLIAGIRRRQGLLSPLALRITAIVFLLMPIAGFFTGYYREHGALAVEQAATYLFIAAGLWQIARRRAGARVSGTSGLNPDSSSRQ